MQIPSWTADAVPTLGPIPGLIRVPIPVPDLIPIPDLILVPIPDLTPGPGAGSSACGGNVRFLHPFGRRTAGA